MLPFAKIIERELAKRHLSPITGALRAGMNRDAIRSVMRGRIPSVDRVAEICDALGLEFYIGPPRGDEGATAERKAVPYDPTLAPEICRDMEMCARWLIRAVVAVGGDPIPEDLWPALDERRGLAALPALAAVGDAPPPAETVNDDDTLMMVFAEDVRAAAGTGEMVFVEAADHRITVPRSILPTWARPAGLACIRAAGDSMVPTLGDGDLLLIDYLNTKPLDGQVFVIHTDDGLVVKRIREEDDGWAMTSDNSAFPSRRARRTESWAGWPGRARCA